MKNLWKAAQVYALVFLCAVFLREDIKAEAACPKKVTEVKQTDAYFNSAEISWKAVPGNNVGYKVEICARRDFKGEIREHRTMGSQKGNMRYDTIAGEPGKTYYVRVTAFYDPDDAHTYGVSSDVLQVVTTPHDELKNFRVTNATETSITLAWDRPAVANSYRLAWIKHKGSSGYQYVELGNVTSYTLNKLSKNTRYSFRILPINKSETGYKAESYLKPTYTSASTIPSKVTGLNFELESRWEPSGERLYYDEQQAADGIHYEIYTAKGKKPIVKEKHAITRTTESTRVISIKNKKLRGYKFLKLRVRAYIVVEGKKKYGKWSNWEYCARQPEIKAKNVSEGIKLSWSKVEGADNYTVYATDNPDFKYKKFKTTKRTSIVLNKCGKSKLKNNKTYHFYVVANKKVGKKTYRSYVWNLSTPCLVYKK